MAPRHGECRGGSCADAPHQHIRGDTAGHAVRLLQTLRHATTKLSHAVAGALVFPEDEMRDSRCV
eukprot:SAG25_NODE_10409_length_335_cov_1.754237_1_plen_64_part_10